MDMRGYRPVQNGSVQPMGNLAPVNINQIVAQLKRQMESGLSPQSICNQILSQNPNLYKAIGNLQQQFPGMSLAEIVQRQSGINISQMLSQNGIR